MASLHLPFRLTAAIAATGLAIAQMTPLPVAAQGAAPEPLPSAQDQQTAGDPPERVGRLARVSGAVSFHAADEDQWSPATANFPLTAGNALWTDAGAQAEIEVSASSVAMAPGTELDIATLNDTEFQATEPQGEIFVRVRAGTQDESYAVQTPRGLVTFCSPGRYAVVAGDTRTPTTVTVVEGSARITGPDVPLEVGPNQTATIDGTDTLQGNVGPAQRDPFLTAMLDREAPPRRQSVAPPPAVAAMPGGEDLAAYGQWAASPAYGQVWYPQVAPEWVPYREGHWAYVAPWGWTWVDDAPWGFAPFHYGRWVQDGGRWGWYPGADPGVTRAPVYAPALVTFFGVGAVVGVGVGAALASGRIGWCPLGPREAYRPWYRASDRYVRQVNFTHVTNVGTVTTFNRTVTVDHFANRGAATVVPASALTKSRPVRPAVQRVDGAQLAQARPVLGQQPLRPTVATAGVTPAVARQFHLQPTPATAAARPAAPGPAIRPTGLSPGAIGPAPGGRPPLPALRNPGQPSIPGTPGGRALTGQAPLASPSAGPVPPAPGGGAGAVPAPNAGRSAFGGAGAPALRTPAAAGQIAPPPIQRPPGGGAPGGGASVGVVRPVPTPGVAGSPGAIPIPSSTTGPTRGAAAAAAIARPVPPSATPAAPGQIAPPPIQHPGGGAAPAAFSRPVQTPGAAGPPAPPPAIGQPGPAGTAGILRPAPPTAPPASHPVAPPPVAPFAPAPPPALHAAPPPVLHTAPPPSPPVARAAPPAVLAAPAPQVQAPPPRAVAPPPPSVRVASPPPPQVHAPPVQAPPPVHAPPPAQAAPAARPAPPPQQQQQQRQKRPGEP